MNKLAIIIPAYKSRFLQKTLESIAAQECHDFTLYIGDDHSPEPIWETVQKFRTQIDLVYHRFPENLGGKDLTGHWSRCIALSTEPVIWLFSDDDRMPRNGVSRILEAVKQHGTQKLFLRFPLAVIDGKDQLKRQNPPLKKEILSGYRFLLDKLNARIDSAACEYVFSRDVWQNTGGFVRFPLAWCSDDATWVRFAEYSGGIRPLPGDPVCWRNAEGENISDSSVYDAQKLQATTLFLCWIRESIPDQQKDPELHHALENYVHTILTHSVRGNFGLHHLLHLCTALWKTDPVTALRVARRHLPKIRTI